MFRNNKHKTHMVEVNSKVALNRYDDKQIVRQDSISTSACGYYSLCWSSLLGVISLS